MKRKNWRTLLVLAGLVVVTCIGMAYTSGAKGPLVSSTAVIPVKSGGVSLSGRLIQDKIYADGDGSLSLALTMQADEIVGSGNIINQHADLVIVLDRSGSMEGRKMQYAKRAILELLSGLNPRDRFALISYSEDVRWHTSLVNVDASSRNFLESAVHNVAVGGSTNLGAGLQAGIDALVSAEKNGNIGKVILISDGLANRGVTDPYTLGRMASVAVSREFAVSTVGVGSDFNEFLMTTIADRGTGNYYFLENPASFARVFQNEFKNTRTAAATGVEVKIPLDNGISLIHAAGFPIEKKENYAVFHPGDLLSGQTRKLYLTLRLPTGKERTFDIAGISASYLYKGEKYTLTLAEPLRAVCVKNREAATASIDRSEWARKVIQEDFNKLQEEVAREISLGNEKEAMEKIDSYYQTQQAVNDAVGSAEVQNNLDQDLEELRTTVKDTFYGAPGEVGQKQKTNSKALQYKGYKGRRAK